MMLQLENAPILVLILDWNRSQWIGIGPGPVEVLTPIWRSGTNSPFSPSFVLSIAATAHSRRAQW